MKRIELGWIMPSGAQSATGRATYVQDVEQRLALIKGHFDESMDRGLPAIRCC